MDEDESLRRYGLRPAETDLDAIRQLLAEQTELEHHRQGDADTALMKLCCVQLFNAGDAVVMVSFVEQMSGLLEGAQDADSILHGRLLLVSRMMRRSAPQLRHDGLLPQQTVLHPLGPACLSAR